MLRAREPSAVHPSLPWTLLWALLLLTGSALLSAGSGMDAVSGDQHSTQDSPFFPVRDNLRNYKLIINAVFIYSIINV